MLFVLADCLRDAEIAMRDRGVPRSSWVYVSQWGHIRGRACERYTMVPCDASSLATRTRWLEYRAYMRSREWVEVPLSDVAGR